MQANVTHSGGGMVFVFTEGLVPSLGYGTTDQPNHQMESVLNTAESLVYHVSP